MWLIPILLLASQAAPPPLPQLRTEVEGDGSSFHIRNVSTLALTAYLIDLVGYPGSQYSYWQDEITQTPLPPGGEKHIAVTNKMAGAVPEYVKLQAAIYADGTTAGVPARVKLLLDLRRRNYATTRELARRLESAQQAATPKADLIAALKQMPANALVTSAITSLASQPLDQVLTGLKSAEQKFAASKPPL